MKVQFHENFNKDLSKIADPILAKQVRKLILRLENSRSLTDISNVKKMQGGPNFFRIRIGDFRVGLTKSGETITLMRILRRREIYRYFP